MRASVRKTSLNEAWLFICRKRPRFDARLPHGQDEIGQAFVLGDLPVGAGYQHGEVGMVGAGVPDLLAVDDPLVAVELGPGRPARRDPSRRLAR